MNYLFNFVALFLRLDEVDRISWNQLANWFAMHLSNTGFGWPYWDSWAIEIVESGDHPSAAKSFLQTLIGKCNRTTIPENMKAALPVELYGLVCLDENTFSPRSW